MNVDELQALKPITEKNEFFDPEAYDVDVLGFFEELIAEDPSSGYQYRLLGNRMIVGLPTRAIGSAGRIEIVIDTPQKLQKGHKMITLNASKKRSYKCFAMIQPLCGQPKEK